MIVMYMDAALTAAPWRDPKKYAWPLAVLVPALPFTSFAAWHAGVPGAWWIAPVVVFGVIPAVEALLGDDGTNPPDDAVQRLQQMPYYRWLTFLYLPAQYAALVLCCAVWVRGGFVDRAGLVFTIGIVNGIAINTAHELGHKREAVERWLSRIALAATGYGHFYVEHNRGHHVRVATPEDPASARLGRASGRSGRARWLAASARPGGSRAAACGCSTVALGTGGTTSSAHGRCPWHSRPGWSRRSAWRWCRC